MKPYVAARAKELVSEGYKALYATTRRRWPVLRTITSGPGFRSSSLRGIDKLQDEWNAIAFACNCKRTHTLRLDQAGLSPTNRGATRWMGQETSLGAASRAGPERASSRGISTPSAINTTDPEIGGFLGFLGPMGR